MAARGFSIIELLVVLAIIGVLTSVALVSYTSVKERGRDARRMQDVQNIQKALASYDVVQGAFPLAVAATTLTGSDSVSAALVGAEVIPSIPRDPTYPARAYTYQSNAAGNAYTITFCLETSSIPNYAPGCSNTLTP